MLGEDQHILGHNFEWRAQGGCKSDFQIKVKYSPRSRVQTRKLVDQVIPSIGPIWVERSLYCKIK